MKKFICTLLMFTVICSMFVACSSEEKDSSLTENTPVGTQGSESNETEKIEETPALEDLFEWQNVEGGIEITKYKGDSKTIEVPEIIENKKVVSVGNAFEGNMVVETMILPKYVESINLTECESLKRVEWAAESIGCLENLHEIFPSCIEEIILPNVKSFSMGFITRRDDMILLKKLEAPAAKEINSIDRFVISVNVDEVIMQGDFNCFIKGSSFNVPTLSCMDEDTLKEFIDNESKYGESYHIRLNDENRDEIFKELFGENVKVTMK